MDYWIESANTLMLCLALKVQRVHQLSSSLQERCCCGGLTVRDQVGMVSAMAALGRVLCLLPGSVGHLPNQPQEIWTMGRWVDSHVSILLPVCVLPLSVWLLCVHSIAGLIPMFPFLFSHSSCDGSIWGYRKGLCTGGEYYIICVAVMSINLWIASFSAGQARAECGHHESLSGQTAESSQRDQWVDCSGYALFCVQYIH